LEEECRVLIMGRGGISTGWGMGVGFIGDLLERVSTRGKWLVNEEGIGGIREGENGRGEESSDVDSHSILFDAS
jgi:hypothetical protein